VTQRPPPTPTSAGDAPPAEPVSPSQEEGGQWAGAPLEVWSEERREWVAPPRAYTRAPVTYAEILIQNEAVEPFALVLGGYLWYGDDGATFGFVPVWPFGAWAGKWTDTAVVWAQQNGSTKPPSELYDFWVQHGGTGQTWDVGEAGLREASWTALVRKARAWSVPRRDDPAFGPYPGWGTPPPRLTAFEADPPDPAAPEPPLPADASTAAPPPATPAGAPA
jgi:hypothetical protein